MRTILQRQHEGYCRMLDELEPYARANPDDKWAAGQVRFAKREVARIAAKIGLSENRRDRPAK
jgi:hypothetical protein